MNFWRCLILIRDSDSNILETIAYIEELLFLKNTLPSSMPFMYVRAPKKCFFVVQFIYEGKGIRICRKYRFVKRN